MKCQNQNRTPQQPIRFFHNPIKHEPTKDQSTSSKWYNKSCAKYYILANSVFKRHSGKEICFNETPLRCTWAKHWATQACTWAKLVMVRAWAINQLIQHTLFLPPPSPGDPVKATTKTLPPCPCCLQLCPLPISNFANLPPWPFASYFAITLSHFVGNSPSPITFLHQF